jgi:hypothetical protein
LEQVVSRPAWVDGKLDVVSYRQQIAEAAKNELAYLASVGGTGRISGMGAGTAGAGTGGGVENLAGALQRLGLSEAAAQAAAKGR